MKSRSLSAGRHVLTSIAAAALCLTAAPASALGLGRLVVRSALGESLRAEIDVTSLSAEEASNLRIRVAPPEQYRAAGVDYSSALQNTQAVLQRRPDGRVYVRLTGDRAVLEPFVDVILELTWNTGRLVRDYTLLLDPPQTRGAAAPAPLPSDAPLPATSPIISAAQGDTGLAGLPELPRAERRRLAARSPVDTPMTATATATATAGRPVRPARERVADAVPPAPVAAAGGYRVRHGDTLSRIASRLQRPGASLDQMLAALYRDNPQAFIGNNIDRLRFGAVLAVPSAAEASAIGHDEARRAIRAQSADFNAYRERLAGATQATAPDAPSRRSGGKVQASVDDRARPAAPTADKLTLGKDGSIPATGTATPPVTAAASAAAAAARARESRDNAARAAELRRNIEELQRLMAAASAPAAAVAPAPAPVPAPPVAAAPAVVVPAPPVVAPPVVVAAAPAPAPIVVPSAPAPAPTAIVVPTLPASRPAAALPASAPASRPAATPPTVIETRRSESFLADNGPALGLGALALALLAGFGLYRRRNRARRDSGETSFLESRLHPDSFFGATGGQRIDTRDAGAPSSMSYSLSQLDAIGDVDPVAEADVYLAYGRDLQAEEILKEAMRAHPERMAIRTKLLEVYAKRRDTKGYELLATQLYGLTYGAGEDWAKAQTLGRQIDPENPLYHPGGQPPALPGSATLPHEPLGASTLPQSVLPQEFGATAPPSGFAPLPPSPAAVPEAEDLDLGLDLDLDLDLDMPAPPPRASAVAETTRPMSDFPATLPPQITDFDLPFDTFPPATARHAPAAALAAAAQASSDLDFELPDIALDFDTPAAAAPSTAAVRSAAPPPADAGTDFAAFDVSPAAAGDANETGADDEADPLERKLELAQEFREIGDSEGARDLLREVLAQASGAQKMRAQSLLDHLG